MKEKILKLLNLKLKSRYQSLINMVYAHPDAFEYIPEPTQEEADAFFKGASKSGARAISKPEVMAKIIAKYRTTDNEQDVIKCILRNPYILNAYTELNRMSAEGLFIRTLRYSYAKRQIEGKQDHLISYISNPTYRMKFFSVKSDPTAIIWIPYEKKIRRLYDMALTKDPWVINLMSNTTPEQRQAAIQCNYNVLSVMREQTEDDCLLALSLSTAALEYVLPKNRTYHMTKTVLEADHDLEWLNNGNFIDCHWSNDELKLMVELGNKKLLGLLSLLIIAGTLEVSEETKNSIEEKLSLKLIEIEEEN